MDFPPGQPTILADQARRSTTVDSLRRDHLVPVVFMQLWICLAFLGIALLISFDLGRNLVPGSIALARSDFEKSGRLHAMLAHIFSLRWGCWWSKLLPWASFRTTSHSTTGEALRSVWCGERTPAELNSALDLRDLNPFR